jgi:hypothetical protein
VIRRTTIITLELLGAALAGASIILAFLTWRLTQEGPIHLRFLSSYVEQALIRSDQPSRIGVDDTVLTWAGWDRALEVRAINRSQADPHPQQGRVAGFWPRRRHQHANDQGLGWQFRGADAACQ